MSSTTSEIAVVIEQSLKYLSNVEFCLNKYEKYLCALAQQVLSDAKDGLNINYELNVADSEEIVVRSGGDLIATFSSAIVPSADVQQAILVAAAQGAIHVEVPERSAFLSVVAYALVARVLYPRCSKNLAENLQSNSSLLIQYFNLKQLEVESVVPLKAVLDVFLASHGVLYANSGVLVNGRDILMLAVDKFYLLKGQIISLNVKQIWYRDDLKAPLYEARDGHCEIDAGLYRSYECDDVVTSDEKCESSLSVAVLNQKTPLNIYKK